MSWCRIAIGLLPDKQSSANGAANGDKLNLAIAEPALKSVDIVGNLPLLDVDLDTVVNDVNGGCFIRLGHVTQIPRWSKAQGPVQTRKERGDGAACIPTYISDTAAVVKTWLEMRGDVLEAFKRVWAEGFLLMNSLPSSRTEWFLVQADR